MRYQTTTELTPRQALEQALADFGPGGVGLQITSQTNLSLVFQGGGRHIMARVHRRRPWWQRWRRRQWPGTSRPASFTVLDHS